MDQIFVQTYRISKATHSFSLNNGNPTVLGRKGKGDIVRGVMRWEKVNKEGRSVNTELLAIGKNEFVEPSAVVLEVVSGVDGGSSSLPSRKAPIPLLVLPAIGFIGGLGIGYHRIKKTGGNKAANYIGWSLLVAGLASIPYYVWRVNNRTGLDQASDSQRNKALTAKAYKALVDLSKKNGTPTDITEEEFGNQFSGLTVQEKEAYLFMLEGAIKLDKKSKKFDQLFANLNREAKQKYSESTMESLLSKMGKI